MSSINVKWGSFLLAASNVHAVQTLMKAKCEILQFGETTNSPGKDGREIPDLYPFTMCFFSMCAMLNVETVVECCACTCEVQGRRFLDERVYELRHGDNEFHGADSEC